MGQPGKAQTRKREPGRAAGSLGLGCDCGWAGEGGAIAKPVAGKRHKCKAGSDAARFYRQTFVQIEPEAKPGASGLRIFPELCFGNDAYLYFPRGRG